MKAWLRRRLAWFFPSPCKDDLDMPTPAAISRQSTVLLVLLPPAFILSLLIIHSPMVAAWCLALLLHSAHRDVAARVIYKETVAEAKYVGRLLVIDEIMHAWSNQGTDPREWLLREAFLGAHVQDAADQVARSFPPSHRP